jgi:hypothetical protein
MFEMEADQMELCQTVYQMANQVEADQVEMDLMLYQTVY